MGIAPIETIDTDGDGEIDCYVYEYSYSGKAPIDMGISGTMPVSGKGKIYIFIDKTEEFVTNPYNRPDGFNPDTDFMATYFIDNNDNVPNPTIKVANSYKCITEVQMASIAKVMREFGKQYAVAWNRTEDSIVTEWREHNRYAFMSDSAKHTDFDNVEEGKGYLGFLFKAIGRFISELF